VSGKSGRSKEAIYQMRYARSCRKLNGPRETSRRPLAREWPRKSSVFAKDREIKIAQRRTQEFSCTARSAFARLAREIKQTLAGPRMEIKIRAELARFCPDASVGRTRRSRMRFCRFPAFRDAESEAAADSAGSVTPLCSIADANF